MNPSLSIVIPAFDEATRIGDTLRQILAYLSQRNLSAELIVVDDGSRDTTARVADEVFAEFPDLPAKVVRYEENRGKGFAVRTGLVKPAPTSRFFPMPTFQRRFPNSRN